MRPCLKTAAICLSLVALFILIPVPESLPRSGGALYSYRAATLMLLKLAAALALGGKTMLRALLSRPLLLGLVLAPLAIALVLLVHWLLAVT